MTVDFWFQFGITILKGVLAGLHLDPTKAGPLRTILLDLANSIYTLYGMVPPTPPAA